MVEYPICNSDYNWKTVSNLTEQDDLCTRWTVTDFNYDSTTNKWTWTCDNSAWSVDCSAYKKQTLKWEYKIEKTLIWTKEIKNTWDAVVWNIKVTAINWDVKDLIITDKMPSILWYSGYMVIRDSWMTISQPILSWNEIIWKATWTLKQWDYVEIQLTTYAKEMPDRDYKNVACVKWTNPSDPEKCDDEDLPAPKIRIKKSFDDGSKKKTVKVWDKMTYKVTFGNSGTASATITSIKDFLPKNVKYISSEIFLNEQSVHTNVASGSEVINTNTRVDGVYVDIFTGITLKPGDTGYILIEVEVLSENKDNRTNFACIYLNDSKIECDDARHDITDEVMCSAPEIDTKTFTKAGWTTNVVCKTAPAWEKANSIELDCGNGTKYTWSNISQLSWSCTYPANSSTTTKSYSVVCKVNWATADNCKWSISVEGDTPPPSTCFVAWTKVVMADGTYKNIEDVKIWEKVLWENWVNTVLWYDRPVLWERHLWSINGGDYFVSDEHPFKTTEWWKSFNPEMTKLEIDLDTTELKVGDVLITSNWEEEVKTIDYRSADYDTPLYNFVLDWDHTYYANDYLVHNKWWDNPYCKAPVLSGSEFTCTSTDRVYAIGIDCDHVTGKEGVDKEKISNNGRENLSVSASCNQNANVQCYVKRNSGDSWQTLPTQCWWTPSPSSTCFVAWTKVVMADGTYKNIEDVKIWEKVLWENWVNTVLWYDRPVLWERHLWSINGGDYFVSDEHPFKTTEWWKSFNPEMTKLEIDLDTTELKVGDVLITSNWEEEVKTIDYRSADYDTPLYNFVLDWDHTYYANDYLVHNKWWGWKVTPIDPDLTCFNVNGWNASIEKWEILPFYLNIYKEKPTDRDFEYVEHKLASYPYWEDNLDMAWESCSKSENGNVALNTLMCHYSIKDWNGKKVDSWEFPCLNASGASQTNLVNAWIDWQVEQYGRLQSYSPNWWTSYTFRSNVHTTNTTNWKDVDKYWEYKIYLDKVEYLYCDGANWTRWEDNDVCQSNFTLTNSYTVQKTPSGNFTNTSTDKLKNYLYADGKSTMDWLLTSIAGTSEYAPNEKVKVAMDNFIKKYEKLAVKVNTEKFWKSVTVKKVPGKDIYFLSWNATFTQNAKTINKPFTIVQTKWSVTIKWDVQHNMMLLTNENIVFSGDCTTTQKVKWIFYAWWKLIRSWVKKNDNINNSFWCDEWWLTVKWVLIWNGLENLMNASRSNLNDWFKARWDDSNSAVLAARRWYVMNWASVLIEYSPSIFTKSTMPPGAEDFTTALSVYKN